MIGRKIRRALKCLAAAGLIFGLSAPAWSAEYVMFNSLAIAPTPLKARLAKARGIKLAPTPGIRLQGRLSRPMADGPAPAVVLLHDCAGIQPFQNAWAAELVSHVRRLDPDDAEAIRIEAAAFTELGRRSVSPNGRSYYLTRARELRGEADPTGDGKIEDSVRDVAQVIPIGNFLGAMPVFLDPEKSADSDLTVGFRFPDVDEGYTIHVRRGVAELRPTFPENPDVAITTDSSVWRDIVLGFRNPALTFASGDVQIDGSALDLVSFLRLFDRR